MSVDTERERGTPIPAPAGVPLLALLLSIAVCMAALAGAGACRPQSEAAQRGERLFTGEEPLSAQLKGQGLALPGEATRCRNCHTHEPNRNPAELAAPALNADALLKKVSRRNGPPSSYDVRTFCILLRTGVDPAHVQVQRLMPRYEIDDAQCDALFAYLTGG